jgi:uncharacterized protein
MVHDLRRDDREITDPADIDRILSAAKFATIALADGPQPYVVTLSCGYDAKSSRLVFHVAPEGHKLDIIAANPLACATVVHDRGYKTGECAHSFESVVLFGRMHVLDAPDEVRQAMGTLIAQLESPDDAAEIWERNGLDASATLERFRMLVFEIEDLTGKAGQ